MTQRVREGAEQVGKKNRSSFTTANVPKACSVRAKQGLKIRKEEVVVARSGGDRGLSRKGRKEGWGPTGQPRLLGQIQRAASPGSNCLQLLPGSGTGST